MFHDAFVKLDKEDTEQVLDIVNPVLQGVQLNPEKTVIMSYSPSFYPGCYFVDMSEYDTIPAQRCFAVLHGKEVFVLNWTNEPIYELNTKVPVSLDIYNICEYVRFFFTFVKGRHGRFLIAETVDDINWKEEPPPAARKAIGKMLTPMEAHVGEDGESFIVKASMMFKDSLFSCDVTVKKDGIVSISGEELLIEEMPVLDDVFGQ